MAKTKVAIVLSGGVSLGAYIAGALDELMNAFKLNTNPDVDYEIDIITGASAGATTAAVIAHGLRYRQGQVALYDVWVKKVDIVDLLADDLRENDPVTVLSSRRLREIALETLRWDDPNNAGQKASFCADDLTLAMTIANTTPLPYISSVKQPTAGGKEEFVQSRHAEQETFTLTDIWKPTDERWSRIGEVAMASAAIPMVFPLVPLERKARETDHYVQTPNFEGAGRFWYYDGGTFNNLPVDLAWSHVVRRAKRDDPGADPLENRRVVVIDPSRSDATVPNLNPPQPAFAEHAMGLFSAIWTESRAIQFEHDIATPSQVEAGGGGGVQGLLQALPGVPRPPVDVLDNFALVMPVKGAPTLRGKHLHSMGAFLDERFREYDFRRGAADAKKLATGLLDLNYQVPNRPPDFYEPDNNPDLGPDIPKYSSLDDIPSARFSGQSVKEVFERALDKRIEAIVRRIVSIPGPDFPLEWAIGRWLKGFAREKLPTLWEQ